MSAYPNYNPATRTATVPASVIRQAAELAGYTVAGIEDDDYVVVSHGSGDDELTIVSGENVLAALTGDGDWEVLGASLAAECPTLLLVTRHPALWSMPVRSGCSTTTWRSLATSQWRTWKTTTSSESCLATLPLRRWL